MRAAIFDLDGTLAETAPDLVGAVNAVLRAEGLPELDYQTARATAGQGGRPLLALGFRMAGRPLDAEGVEARVPAFLVAYENRIAEETHVFDGVVESLAALAEDGWRLGVCTNKPERLARLLLERLDLARHFRALLGRDTLTVRKPDPRHLLETIARVGGDPRRGVLIGDSVTDRDAARNAGTAVILTSFGYSLTPVADLAPDAVIDRYEELIPALERLRL